MIAISEIPCIDKLPADQMKSNDVKPNTYIYFPVGSNIKKMRNLTLVIMY